MTRQRTPAGRGRRRYRGVTLIEATLSLAVLTITMSQLVPLVNDWLAQQAAQVEAVMLSAAVDAAQIEARGAFLSNVMAAQGSGGGRVTNPSLPPSVASSTPMGRTIRFGHYAPASDQLVILAWTTTEPLWPTARPRGGDGIRYTGIIDNAAGRCGSGYLCGSGLDWNFSPVSAVLGSNAPAVGAMVAVRWLTLDNDVRPYLHRVAVAGYPELQRLEADLDLAGQDLVVDGSVGTDRLTVAGRLELAGTMRGIDLEIQGPGVVLGDVEVSGDLAAEPVVVLGDVTVSGTTSVASSLHGAFGTFNDRVTVARMVADQEIVAPGGVRVAGTAGADMITAATLEVTGDLSTALLSYASDPLVLDELLAVTIYAEDLVVTGECSGCTRTPSP